MPKRPDEVFFEGLGAISERQQVEEASQDPMQEKTAQQALRAVTKSNLFSHPEAHAFVLDLALLKVFQLEWLTWSPDTLFTEIQKTFSTSIADINRVKIMTTMTLHVTDVFWYQWEVFEKGILALNGIIPRTNLVQPPDVPILMAGVDIVNSIREEEFSEEVARYAAACFMHDEVGYAPEPLDFCQKYLSQPRYKCKECGKNGSALPPFDGRCDSCSRKFDGNHPFDFKPAEDAKDKPEDVEYYQVIDPEPTRKRFDELVKLPAEKVKIEEVAEDIEAAKLISAVDYMEFRRGQRDRQLSEIKDWMVVS
jgi:hypothetical protein